MRFTEKQVFFFCDYVFTLLLSMAIAGMLIWCDVPWWIIVIAVHYETATWFRNRK